MDYLRKFHKATGMPTSWLDLLCWTLSSADSPLCCPVANCLPAPLSNQLSSRVPLLLPATPRFQVQKPFVWFRAKTDKGIVCLAGHLYSVTFIPQSSSITGASASDFLVSYPGHLSYEHFNLGIVILRFFAKLVDLVKNYFGNVIFMYDNKEDLTRNIV